MLARRYVAQHCWLSSWRSSTILFQNGPWSTLVYLGQSRVVEQTEEIDGYNQLNKDVLHLLCTMCDTYPNIFIFLRKNTILNKNFDTYTVAYV
jgi:hypothetical protein